MDTKQYKDTLNLPKTSFPMKANLSQKEPSILKKWADEGLYAAIKTKSKGKPKYILHDGPPYANGNIHVGHVLNKVLKDIITKYKTMRGFDSFFLPGWDCHGLPIEHQLFKELKITKEQIEQYIFRRKARDYANKYVKIQREEFKRLGVFGEWETPYLTMNYEYQASIIESFAKLYVDGYIYKGEKPIHWCSSCETALAEAELEYANKVSDSIFVRAQVDLSLFKDMARAYSKLKKYSEKHTLYILIWTTTPWTLPANVAIALHPDYEYVLFEESKSGDMYIIASDLIDSVTETIGMKGKVRDKIKGSQLEKVAYQHPFLERNSGTILANFVSNTDGCGCVHIAPGHGQEDYEVGLKYDLPIISPVNEKGEFTGEFQPAQGVNVFKANAIVLDLLKKNGHLMAHSTITHSYPHCWRCKQPVIFRATKQWFLNIEHKNLRQRLIDTVKDEKKTTWIPHWGQNRILGMLESRPDWCLSRQRYWGVPIPILYCTECEHEYFSPELITQLIEKVKKDSADIWFKLSADELVPDGAACSNCKSKTFKKEHDIIDVWFDSGVSHQAVLKNNKQLNYPCELYLEGSDQHRGWFQTSLITALSLDNAPPFKTVVTHGFAVDGAGKKMSKSAGNVVVPRDVMKTYGADILRLWVSSCDISQDVRVSDDILKQMADAYRKMRNTLRFLIGNLNDFNYKTDKIAFDKLDGVDKWALGKCLLLVEEVERNYDTFRFHQIYRLIYNFCVIEMSSFYLDILKDRLYTARSDSFERRSSQTAMFYIVRNLVKILAPILSFTTEEIWSAMTIEKGVASVHCADWPGSYHELIDQKTIDDWDRLAAVRNQINPLIEKKREQNIIGSSLEAKVELFVTSDELYEFLQNYHQSLPLVFIVSHVSLHKSTTQEIAQCDTVFDANEKPLYRVVVSKAAGDKCIRCWNYSKDIGKDSAHPMLCPKCTDAVQK
ncbi:MAG: isoleucine--tRNA ligase [Candidatus Omnitrophica bacterium]|nr:isoleucine--tRNA ligase [Candidatus Omnitrophota bacterium]